MESALFDFRNAAAVLASQGDAWNQIISVIGAIDDAAIIERQSRLTEGGRRPKGGQTALNALFKESLAALGWEAEPRLFSSEDADLRRWKMDFYKPRVGIEIAFNHAEAIPWIFTRLNLAGESSRVRSDHRIEVGVAMFATDALKAWARMDSAVGTFAIAKAWLEEMKPILPIPIMVVGLDPGDWLAPGPEVFPGTQTRN